MCCSCGSMGRLRGRIPRGATVPRSGSQAVIRTCAARVVGLMQSPPSPMQYRGGLKYTCSYSWAGIRRCEAGRGTRPDREIFLGDTTASAP